jgi:pimeloyl-ACP methyl ester carboxylesterase
MPFEKVNNLQVYYEIHGEGEPVIFMHHGFGCTRMWSGIYPRFALRGYKVIMYDRRGYGRSEPGEDFQDFYETDRYRPESVEELRIMKERLGIRKCHIVGQCEGGVVGVDYAVKYPEEIKTLTVGGTQCYSDVPMTELNALKLVSPFVRLDPALQAKMVAWHGDAAECTYNQFTKYGGAYGRDYFDLRPILPSVSCPTLVLYPDRSFIFGVEQAVSFYRHLPKGELAIFPRCGHNTYEQRPEEYTRTIIDFMMRNAGGEDSKERPAMTCLA